jgi:hypothetical protein
MRDADRSHWILRLLDHAEAWDFVIVALAAAVLVAVTVLGLTGQL